MVFGPPQHRSLGWLTPPPSADILRGSLSVGFDLTSGPIPNNAISKFQTARSGLYAERRRLNPDGGSYQGARFPPRHKGRGFTRA
jgi:hypothetical protein